MLPIFVCSNRSCTCLVLNRNWNLKTNSWIKRPNYIQSFIDKLIGKRKIYNKKRGGLKQKSYPNLKIKQRSKTRVNKCSFITRTSNKLDKTTWKTRSIKFFLLILRAKAKLMNWKNEGWWWLYYSINRQLLLLILIQFFLNCCKMKLNYV